MVFTPEQDDFILMAHFRSGTRNPDGTWSYSLQSCIDQFTEAFPDANVGYQTFANHKGVLVHPFETKNCIYKGKTTGRKTVLTEEVTEDIQHRLEQSPNKSIRKLSAQTGLSVGSCHKALHKVLHMHPYKVSVVHELLPPDFERRINYCQWFNNNLNDDALLDLTFFTDEACVGLVLFFPESAEGPKVQRSAITTLAAPLSSDIGLCFLKCIRLLLPIHQKCFEDDIRHLCGDLRSSNDKSCKTSKPLCNNDDDDDDDDDDDLSLILEVIEQDLNQNKTNDSQGCSRRNTATSDGFTAPNQIVKRQSNTDDDELSLLLEVIDEDLKTTSVTRNRKIINDTSLACSVKKQVGKGVRENSEVENFTYFIKRGESENFNKKFSLTSRRMEFSFKPLGHLQQPLQWLKQALRELLDHITRECEADDIVGFVMENDDFPDKPIGISLRKRSQLDENVILAVLAKLEDRSIIRNAQYDVLTKNTTKKYAMSYTKRRRLEGTFETVPYGYNDDI
ncbi:hypothetical protein Zmor_011095 [Zophobas morio]|uniref:Uncharacterized protein n=1 Tax=Zophobas morio TaxID=2755281 RepID=A0AA38MJA0_9CUCU|nr:hypothetical protein Zmor_011095 [Zophobas morio]